MNSLPMVAFLGDQKIAWALDEDLLWIRKACLDQIQETPVFRAATVISAWWPAVVACHPWELENKRVICFADNPPSFYLTVPGFLEAASRVDLWVARSREAASQFQAIGLPVARAPYCADPEVFKPLAIRASIRQELGIPGESFVIGNFHRDSEGADLSRPKLQKGPDRFLEVARGLFKTRPNLRVLLAGPRRHWLRQALAQSGIPCTFAGTITEEDDYPLNILGRDRLNQLYHALDMCVISSRWEGGPYSVLEALFSGCPVISTPVGTARDVLPPELIFRTPEEAVRIVESGLPAESIRHLRKAALQSHTLPALKSALAPMVESLSQTRPDPLLCAKSLAGRVLAKAGFKPRFLPRKLTDLRNILEAVQEEGPSAGETPVEFSLGMREALIQTARHWRTLSR